jgi:hypothetical protein
MSTKTSLYQDYLRATKSVHVPFIQTVALRLDQAREEDKVDYLVERIYQLTEGWKYPPEQSIKERFKNIIK